MVTNFIYNLTIAKQKYRSILYVKSNYVGESHQMQR